MVVQIHSSSRLLFGAIFTLIFITCPSYHPSDRTNRTPAIHWYICFYTAATGILDCARQTVNVVPFSVIPHWADVKRDHKNTFFFTYTCVSSTFVFSLLISTGTPRNKNISYF